ncbi:IclR family transcriptional regulator [Actinocorallia sp. A-T 12471]|uniref:IclR family transcriptional regulator n=1 Tax=Actinocorallia sp. A-T 12471 TaxID=3089813 RepID=UPI0029CB76B1|nr:helix-turn-helix domain-containing protein [Actinocorallia sp. A-T 12471]MDX6740007.1 helix-turn-helix domain-containing protein [Actinocorallia sp. A-T 12471]
MAEGTQAVGRALGVLRCFADDGTALGASDLARRLELPTSTTFRLARALVAEGFLEQDPRTSRYRLGPAVAELGRRSFHQRGLHRAAPELAHLAKETGCPADLAMRDGHDALILLGGPSGTGHRVRHPLRTTAQGLVLAAFAAPAPDGALAEIRAAGHAVHADEPGSGRTALAVPILDHTGVARYALAVRPAETRLSARLDWLLSRARSCARSLETALLPPDERRQGAFSW